MGKSFAKNKENPPKETKKATLKEALSDLKEATDKYKLQKEKRAETDKFMNHWKSRKPMANIDFPVQGTEEKYTEFTPERDVVCFLTNWQKGNYGQMAKQICFFRMNLIWVKKQEESEKFLTKRI
ncbi:hypothetical protein BOQ64_00775 [Chryseobacterium sp. CH25]|nr:hypothetical protein BOQ64_00775 [Chryseobacterium sp. CH25]